MSTAPIQIHTISLRKNSFCLYEVHALYPLFLLPFPDGILSYKLALACQVYTHGGVMKESRLFQILYYLMDHESCTAEYLSRELEVSLRTIYRDIDRLSEAGIPVYTTQGRGGGIKLMEGFTLKKALLSGEEREMILSSLESLQLVGRNSDAILRKLSSLFQMQQDHWLEVEYSQWGGGAWDPRRFALLKEAILCLEEVDLEYYNAQGQHSNRRVRPLRLLFKSYAWYLKGFDCDKEAFRIFKLSRIVRIKSTGKSFERMEYPAIMNRQDVEMMEVRLHFSPSLAFRVYDEFDPSAIHKEMDGSLVVASTLPSGQWLEGYLLSFGAGVEVLSPQWLQQSLLAEAKKIVCMYNT